jgi:hypothetical protein
VKHALTASPVPPPGPGLLRPPRAVSRLQHLHPPTSTCFRGAVGSGPWQSAAVLPPPPTLAWRKPQGRGHGLDGLANSAAKRAGRGERTGRPRAPARQDATASRTLLAGGVAAQATRWLGASAPFFGAFWGFIWNTRPRTAVDMLGLRVCFEGFYIGAKLTSSIVEGGMERVLSAACALCGRAGASAGPSTLDRSVLPSGAPLGDVGIFERGAGLRGGSILSTL